MHSLNKIVLSSLLILSQTIYSSAFAKDNTAKMNSKESQLISLRPTLPSLDNNLDYAGTNSFFLCPDKLTTIKTALGDITLSAGAAVFIIESEKNAVIYNLCQSKPNQVYVIVNKNKQFVETGSMLVLTRQNTHDFKELDLDCRWIACSSIRELPWKDEIKAFVARFSICSAFLTVKPLRQLLASNDQHDKLALERILKGAAILGDYVERFEPTPHIQLSVDKAAKENHLAVKLRDQV